jgi:Holliday junction DNA helicase RuvA
MIASLNGKVLKKATNSVILEVSGVGYSVRISLNTLENLPNEGENLFLHIHHHFTESDQMLFGFNDLEEKRMFELLINVKGVGPKLALTILSGAKPNDLQSYIASKSLGLLSKIPGIGKKTAERIVLELKDKIGELSDSNPLQETVGNVFGEVVSALEQLGYKRNQAESAASQAMKSGKSDLSYLIKEALRVLNL